MYMSSRPEFLPTISTHTKPACMSNHPETHCSNRWRRLHDYFHFWESVHLRAIASQSFLFPRGIMLHIATIYPVLLLVRPFHRVFPCDSGILSQFFPPTVFFADFSEITLTVNSSIFYHIYVKFASFIFWSMSPIGKNVPTELRPQLGKMENSYILYSFSNFSVK